MNNIHRTYHLYICATKHLNVHVSMCPSEQLSNYKPHSTNYHIRSSFYHRLAEAGVPLSLLPRVRAASSTSGHMTRSWYAIGSGVDVAVCAGDLQSSVYSRLHGHGDDYTAAGLYYSLVTTRHPNPRIKGPPLYVYH